MCLPNFIKIEQLSAKESWRGKKWSKQKARTSQDARSTLLPNTKSRFKRSWGSWKFACSLVNYLHYVCAKFHPNRTIFMVKGLPRKKVFKPKSPNYRRCATFRASNDKTSAQRELKKLKLCKYLINWFDYVCAKAQANPKSLRVKGLVREKVVKPKSTNFTRCLTYSASDHKISSQEELRKMKLCILLVKKFYYVRANFPPNRTTSSVKVLARRKVAEPKSTLFTRCLTYTASNQKRLSQGECRKLRLCM